MLLHAAVAAALTCAATPVPSAAHGCPCTPACPAPGSPVVPGKERADQAELAAEAYTIQPVCKEHMPGLAWAHPHQ